MTVKIKKLTDEQTAMLPQFVDKWTNIGLCTEPANRPEAEKHLAEAYKQAGLEPPKKIYWAESPQAGHNLHCKLSGKNEWVLPFYGQHEAGWLSFYDVFDTFGIDCSKLHPLMELAKNCGWVWMFDEVAICTERPKKICRNQQNRLHNTEGKAIEYPDGWGLYAYNGTIVPEKLIMNPQGYTKEEILALNNTEVIRALAENLGWDNYLTKIGAKVIDEWIDPKENLKYELLESTSRVGDMEPRFLKKQSSVLKDGSQPWYIEPVHYGLQSAQAARKFQAMSSFINEGELEEFDTLMDYCNNNPELEYAWEH